MSWENLNDQIQNTDHFGCNLCDDRHSHDKKDKCHHHEHTCDKLNHTISHLCDRVLSLEQKTEWLTQDKWQNNVPKCKAIKGEDIIKVSEIIFQNCNC